jgi:hypothetical protein
MEKKYSPGRCNTRKGGRFIYGATGIQEQGRPVQRCGENKVWILPAEAKGDSRRTGIVLCGVLLSE